MKRDDITRLIVSRSEKRTRKDEHNRKRGLERLDVYINRKVYQYFIPKVYHLD